MSFWKKLFGGDAEVQEPAAVTSQALGSKADEKGPSTAPKPSPAADRVKRVRRTGQADGATVAEALAALRSASGVVQGQLLEAALLALERPDARLDPLRIACARQLSDSGEAARAHDVIRSCRDPHGLLLAADLHAASGDIARALSVIERVLARDIDITGGRERHARWNAMLGRSAPSPDAAQATVVVPINNRNNAYRLLREVARGGAGVVYEAEDVALGRRVAYKVYHRAVSNRAVSNRAQLLREARSAAALLGPGVIRVFDCDADAGWIAYEWAGGGSLHQRLQGVRVKQLLPLSMWLPALVAALTRVHAAGKAHADIKPGNVLFRTDGSPIISDFGLSQHPGEALTGGTPGYLSPERLTSNSASFADDIYALGRIIEDVLEATETLAHDAVAQRQRQALTTLMWRCLGEAENRPSAEDLAQALRDALGSVR